MKNIFYIVLLISLSFGSIHAQDKKLSFGLNLFPNYSKGIISNNGNAPLFVESYYRGSETWKLSFSTSIFIDYQLNKRFTLALAFGYQNNGQSTNKEEIIQFTNPNTGIQVFDPAIPNQSQMKYNHHNFEIPLYLKYSISNRFYILVGTSGVINISNYSTNIKYYTDKPTEKHKEKGNSTEYRKLNIYSNLGFGINFFQKEKFSLFLQPTFQYGILGISKNAPLNRNILSAGLTTGIRF